MFSRSDTNLDGGSGTSTALRFEPVRAEHVDALVALFERNRVPQVTAMFDPFPLDASQAQRIALESRKDRFYTVSRGERLLGLSMLRGFDEGYATPSFGIFVDHESHGQGIGRQLTAWTVEQARRQGAPAVRLTVYASNAAARRLYESLGFVEQERRSAQRPGGPGAQSPGGSEEKLVMRLDFDA